MSSDKIKKVIGKYSYYMSDKIGSGLSSTVYRGVNEQTKAAVAIKIMPKCELVTPDQLIQAKKQIKYLQKLRNEPYIIQIKESCQTKNNLYIISELCAQGNIQQLLHKSKKIPQKQALCYLKQIIKGTQSLQKHNIIHRDLKPLNIFISDNNEIRIGDLGFAITALNNQILELNENSGSPFYMSYQSLKYSQLSFQSDIWAIGVTFYQMLTGKFPWKSKTQIQLIKQIYEFDPQNLDLSQFSAESQRFIHRTLQKIDDRMKCKQLYTFFDEEVAQPTFKHKQRNSIEKFQINQSPIKNKTLQKDSIHENRHLNIKTENTKVSHPMKKGNIQKQVNRDTLLNPKVQQKFKISQTILSSKMTNNTQPSSSQSIPNKQQLLNKRKKNSIMPIIEIQIKYFRYIYKLFQIIHLTIKSQDPQILQFKSNLMYLCLKNIQEISQLRYIKSISVEQLEQFKRGTRYKGIISLLNKYKQRYYACLQNYKIQISYKSTNHFDKLSDFVQKVIYADIIESDGNFQKIQTLVVIFSQLMCLNKLIKLHELKDWNIFSSKAEINQIQEKQRPKDEIIELWNNAKQIFLTKQNL